MHKAENKDERYPGTCPGKSFTNFCLTVTRVFKSLRLAWFLHSDSSTFKTMLSSTCKSSLCILHPRSMLKIIKSLAFYHRLNAHNTMEFMHKIACYVLIRSLSAQNFKLPTLAIFRNSRQQERR